MNICTSLEQSRKLAEILPKDSADMHYARIEDDGEMRDWAVYLSPIPKICALYVENLPCWSLSALLAQMPCVELVSSNDGHYRAFWHEMFSKWHSNPVDACMELLNRKHSAELHSCRQCAFCDWHGQYCRAKDADMGKAFMIAQKQCNYFEERKEE